MFFDLFGYIGPFGPLPNLFGRTNHTNLTRRIDPRHPEPPNSSILPTRAFSFFCFLGFGAEGVRFQGFRGGEVPLAGSWGNAPAGAGGMHRGSFHYPIFKETQ